MFLQRLSAALVTLLSITIWFFVPPLRRLSPLFQQFRPREPIKFALSPNEVNSADVTVLFILILWRLLKSIIGIDTKIKFVPVDGDPDLYTFWHHETPLTVNVPFKPSPKDKAAFARAVVGRDSDNQAFRLEDYHLSPFLAGVTFPANLFLLASPQCPIQMFGAVNTRNEFRLGVSPEVCKNLLFTKSISGDLVIGAYLDPKAKKLPRGWEFKLILDIINTTTREVVFSETHFFMQFAKHKDAAELREKQKASATVQDPMFEEVSSSSKITFSTKDPRSWAAVCKDYNLIHVNTLAARMFGFKSVIAHGNHVMARVLDSERVFKKRSSVHLKRPVLLPAVLEIRKDASGNIGVFNRDKLSMVLTDIEWSPRYCESSSWITLSASCC